jgi:hypothetical protein
MAIIIQAAVGLPTAVIQDRLPVVRVAEVLVEDVAAVRIILLMEQEIWFNKVYILQSLDAAERPTGRVIYSVINLRYIRDKKIRVVLTEI